MKKIYILLVISLFLFSGCEKNSERPLVLSANLWIGYSPLYYAESKGWLNKNNIKFVNSISTGEAADSFNSGFIDIFGATQYEYFKLFNISEDKYSYIMIDHSNGGDMVLSNRSIKELQTEKKIDVFLEVESVNYDLFMAFIKKFNIDKSAFNIINSTQNKSAKLSLRKKATIVVTFAPHNIKLKKSGYKEISSTKDFKMLVVDAVFIPSEILEEFPNEINSLNNIMAKSLNNLRDNPKEYYESISKFYSYKNFSEFEDDTKLLEWIYNNNENSILVGLESLGLDKKNIIKNTEE